MLQPQDGPSFGNEMAPNTGTPIYIQLQGFAQVNKDGNVQFSDPKFKGIMSLSSVKQTIFKTTVNDTVVYFATVLIPYDADTAQQLMLSNVPILPGQVPGVVIVKPPVVGPKGDEVLVNFVFPQYSA